MRPVWIAAWACFGAVLIGCTSEASPTSGTDLPTQQDEEPEEVEEREEPEDGSTQSSEVLPFDSALLDPLESRQVSRVEMFRDLAQKAVGALDVGESDELILLEPRLDASELGALEIVRFQSSQSRVQLEAVIYTDRQMTSGEVRLRDFLVEQMQERSPGEQVEILDSGGDAYVLIATFAPGDEEAIADVATYQDVLFEEF